MTNNLDDIAPSFRAAKDRWLDAPNMQAHYEDLSRTFESNGSSLIELIKSFLEMVCITVINEIDGDVPKNCSTTDYVVLVLDKLGLRNTRGASAFDKVLSAHNKLADALTDVRNIEGSISHGKNGFIDSISDHHARVYLLSADAIISLILRAYEGVDPSILKTREPHSRFSHHNAKIDIGTQVEAKIDEDGILELSFSAGSLQDIGLRTSASELLYYLDRQAYVDVLDALGSVIIKPEEEGAPSVGEAEIEKVKEEIVEETGSFPVGRHQESTSGSLKPIINYKGKFADKVNPFYEFMMHTILSGDDSEATQVLNFTYTLLNGMEELAVIDWNKRDSTRSRARLFVKKLLKLFSIKGIEIDSIDKIVEWMEKRIPGGET
jgi:hypothetical protein